MNRSSNRLRFLRIKRFIVLRVLKRNLPLSLVDSSFELPCSIKTLNASPYGNQTCCNINFDDLSPKFCDEERLDFGGSVNQGLSSEMLKFLDAFPYAAITFFVVPSCISFTRKPSRSLLTSERYNIASRENRVWLNYYKSLSASYHVELSVHGCRHYQTENPFFGHHTEFAFKSETESLVAVTNAKRIFNLAGLSPKGFRPPGWDMNSDLSLCRALRENEFNYVASSSYDGGFNNGRTRVSDYYPTMVDGLMNIPQNIELDWPLDRIKRRVAEIISQHRGILSIKGHFVNGVLSNALTSDNIRKLYSIMAHLREEYFDQIEFATMEQIAERYSGLVNDK